MQTCPPREEIAAYLSGGTPPETRRSFEEHLSTCASCRRTRDELSTDGKLFAELRRAKQATTEVEPIGGVRGLVQPQRVGTYHLKRIIASGGMGTVYEAVQENPRRSVALKVMRAGITSKSALRRFEYESQILARLRHAHIAQVYEAGMHRDGGQTVPFFAMEYIPSALPIHKYVKAKKLGTRERLQLFLQVTAAVHHGHQKGVIHRDLKPGNILVDPDGQVKIIDFGVARATDSDMALTTMQTDVGQLLGTLQYMSPEQCAADPHDLDVRSDVYALGVVLYELLCDRLPYDLTATAVFEATRIIRESPPKRPSGISRTLRGDIETITLKALEKDRARRYQSAEELGADIARYLGGEPISARPPSVWYGLWKWTRKRRVAVGVAAVLVPAMATAAYFNRQWREADRLAAERKAQADGSWAMLEAASEPESSIQRLREIVSEYPQLLKERIFLAHLLYRQGFTDESAREARAVLKDHPEAGEAHLLLADYYRQANPELAKEHRGEGRRLLPNDDFWRALAMEPEESAHAIRLLKHVVAKDGSNFEARWELAWRHAELDEYAEMLKHTQILTETHGNLPLVWNAHAIAQRGLGLSKSEPADRNAMLEASIQSFDKALELQPKAPNFYASRAGTLRDLGKLQEALRDCEAALKLDNNHDGACLMRAHVLLLMDELDAATESIENAMALGPVNPDEVEVERGIRARRHYLSGLSRSRAGDFSGALEDFDQAIALNTKDGHSYYARGRMRRFLRQHEKALADHDAAIEFAPQKCYLHQCRAITSRCLGNDEEALADLARGIECARGPAALIHLSEWEVQALRGRGPEAQEALGSALKQATGRWEPILARFVADMATPDELRSSASNKGEAIEAEYFIGVKALLGGHTQEARERFQQCVDALHLDDLTYDSAKYHLDRMSED